MSYDFFTCHPRIIDVNQRVPAMVCDEQCKKKEESEKGGCTLPYLYRIETINTCLVNTFYKQFMAYLNGNGVTCVNKKQALQLQRSHTDHCKLLYYAIAVKTSKIV